MSKKKKNMKKVHKNTTEKVETRKNVFGTFGFFLLLLTLFTTEIILKFLFGPLQIFKTIARIGYGLSILFGILSFVQDSEDKKRGYKTIGDTNFAILSILISFYLIVVDLVK